MMRQLPETPAQKNSLFNAMNSFLGAVNNMDQTVMVPSLLRDVPLGDDKPEADEGDADMYSYYQLLKSIRRDMEWGLRVSPADKETPPRLSRANSTASSASSASCASSLCSASSEDEDDDDEEEDDEDLQKQFQYHLAGLQEVLSKLTTQAKSLTKRYKQSIGL